MIKRHMYDDNYEGRFWRNLRRVLIIAIIITCTYFAVNAQTIPNCDEVNGQQPCHWQEDFFGPKNRGVAISAPNVTTPLGSDGGAFLSVTIDGPKLPDCIEGNNPGPCHMGTHTITLEKAAESVEKSAPIPNENVVRSTDDPICHDPKGCLTTVSPPAPATCYNQPVGPSLVHEDAQAQHHRHLKCVEQSKDLRTQFSIHRFLETCEAKQ